MMNKLAAMLFAVLTYLLPGSIQAQTTFTLNFEDGLALAQQALASHQLAYVDNFYLNSYGVSFSNLAFVQNGPYFILNGGPIGAQTSGQTELILPTPYTSATSSFTFDASSVTILAVGQWGTTHDVTMTAYDAAGVAVSYDTFDPTSISNPQLAAYAVPLTVAGNNIRSVSLTSTSPPVSLQFDDMTVNAVPEPSTYALMLVGLVGVGAAARRRLTV